MARLDLQTPSTCGSVPLLLLWTARRPLAHGSHAAPWRTQVPFPVGLVPGKPAILAAAALRNRKRCGGLVTGFGRLD